MSPAVCLMLASLVLAVLGAPVLARLTRRGAAPLLGVTAWLVALATVLATWLGAAALLAGQLLRGGQAAIGCCGASYQATGTTSGAVVDLILLVSAGLGILALGRLAWRLAALLGSARRHNRRHGRAARLVGRALAAGDAVVLDAQERVAYCVAGRPGTIVVSSGALATLTDTQLNAVLAHERAHLSGHHHLIMATTRALAALLPGVPLFAAAAIQVPRLLEMRADDHAARTHGRDGVAGALAAMTGHAPLPETALGATGTSVAARIERLLLPVGPARRTATRAAVTLTLSAFVLVPATVATVSVLAPLCGATA